MKHLRSLLVLLAALALAACGGGSGTILDPDGGNGGNGGGNGGGGTGTVSIGSGIPPNFTAGTIDIAVPTLSAGGSTSLTTTLVSNGALYTQSVDVTFTSACIAQGLASVTSPVTTTTGFAQTNYVASGCSGADVITATATVGGSTVSATGTVTVASAAVGSIQFVSATPENIGLQGTGGVGLPETSIVVFRVVDSTGGPVPGEDVTFSLNTQVGGIALTPTTATTAADGRVQTVIQAGTVATTVRVTATVDSTGTATQSSQLIVTTGLPHQNAFSIAMEQCPNMEAFNHDGVVNPITVRLADRFQNPVPDGTAITFNTEGGHIVGGCTTDAGACTVDWTSANPRPSDGRVTIIATAIGEESFSDANSNGYFDDGDSVFFDLDEPFRDDDESGDFNSALDNYFFDFNNNNIRDIADGQYSGLLCGGPTGAGDVGGRCSADNTIGISASTVIIMATDAAIIDHLPAGDLALTGTPLAVDVLVSDAKLDPADRQPMAAGTTIKVETTNGQIVSADEYTVPCVSAPGPLSYRFFLRGDTTPSSGIMTITVTSPGGLSTFDFVTVTD